MTGLVLAALALAGLVYNIDSAEKQRQEIDNEKGRAAARAQAQQDELRKKQEDAKNQEALIRTRDAQAMRMKVGALGKQGRSGTILTSPSGTPLGGASTPAAPGGKTILGA